MLQGSRRYRTGYRQASDYGTECGFEDACSTDGLAVQVPPKYVTGPSKYSIASHQPLWLLLVVIVFMLALALSLPLVLVLAPRPYHPPATPNDCSSRHPPYHSSQTQSGFCSFPHLVLQVFTYEFELANSDKREGMALDVCGGIREYPGVSNILRFRRSL